MQTINLLPHHVIPNCRRLPPFSHKDQTINSKHVHSTLSKNLAARVRYTYFESVVYLINCPAMPQESWVHSWFVRPRNTHTHSFLPNCNKFLTCLLAAAIFRERERLAEKGVWGYPVIKSGYVAGWLTCYSPRLSTMTSVCTKHTRGATGNKSMLQASEYHSQKLAQDKKSCRDRIVAFSQQTQHKTPRGIWAV